MFRTIGEIMMYNNKLAVALKANGKVLREFKDTVYVPFGTEYTIFIKNLNTVRASVTIEVDGQAATENVSLIINPKEELELTRFIKNGNLTTGNRFKFIERSANIEQHRGVGVEDGLIRIEFEFERELQQMVTLKNSKPWWDQKIGSPWYGHEDKFYYADPSYTTCDAAISKGVLRSASPAHGELMNSVTCNAVAYSANAAPTMGMATAACAAPQSFNDVGITVPGSLSDQKFSAVHGFNGDGIKHAIVLKLLGESPAGQLIQQPVTVKAKPKCTTCGKTNKATARFCSDCGTSLVIV